jgi:aminomethyltransferase
MEFMTSKILAFKKGKTDVRVSRCGYTGEDGFEVSVPEKQALTFVEEI